MIQNKTYKKIKLFEIKLDKFLFRGKFQNFIYTNEKEFNRLKKLIQ